MRHFRKYFMFCLFFLFVFLCYDTLNVSAASLLPMPAVDVKVGPSTQPTDVVTALQILFLFTIIGLAPSIIIMLTSFTRIIIALHFLRSALGTQQMPPNQILIGLALFLTFFIMGPTLTDINENALKPYSQGLMSQDDAIKVGMEPLRQFMFRQTEVKDMALFIELSGQTYESEEDIPSRVLIPAFILGELTKGFRFGFIVYMPFIAIDMIVASVLMAMGMMMLPPAMISLPFKILLFVMVDGWSLIIENLVRTFR